MTNRRVRVRSKRLDQVEDSRLALALWLMASDLVEDKTAPRKSDRRPGTRRGDDTEGA